KVFGPTPSPAKVSEPMTDVVALADARGFRCTAVLVAPAWVLTARHCLPATRALFGTDIQHPASSHRIVDSRLPDEKSSDAALVKIDPPSKVPVRDRRTAAQSSVPSGVVIIAGFGASDRSGVAGKGLLRTAEIPTFGWGCDAARASSTGCRPGSEM